MTKITIEADGFETWELIAASDNVEPDVIVTAVRRELQHQHTVRIARRGLRRVDKEDIL